jgi:hypothetical protein
MNFKTKRQNHIITKLNLDNSTVFFLRKQKSLPFFRNILNTENNKRMKTKKAIDLFKGYLAMWLTVLIGEVSSVE